MYVGSDGKAGNFDAGKTEAERTRALGMICPELAMNIHAVLV